MQRQVYDDGSFVQNSTNYHRVMMDDMLWAIRLGQISGQPLPEPAIDRFVRATNWLAEMTNRDSGGVPNYGANDGAMVLPLTCCDYMDYRSTLQAAYGLISHRRRLSPGPWDEKSLWLLGEEQPASAEPTEPSCLQAATEFADGGYYILRGPNSWLMTRCHSYHDRPGQCDMLHADLWYKGINVLRDGGTYLYNCDESWRRFFNGTAAHNTVQVDG